MTEDQTWVPLEDKVREVFEARRDMRNGAIFFSRKNSDFREWLILCTICDRLRQSGESPPLYAKKTEGSDFLLKDTNNSEFGCEVTEALRPGYRRDDYWKRVESAGGSLSEEIEPLVLQPWNPLRNILLKKSAKPYAKSSWLLIVFNIGRFHMLDFESPFHDQILSEHGREPFSSLSEFKRVLVLSADFSCLVELFPEERPLVRDVCDISGECSNTDLSAQ